MSLINTTLQTLSLRLRDMTGTVSVQKLHSRIFDAYEAKSLVLEALTIEHQRTMVVCNGVIPTGAACGAPIVLESWAELMAVHKPENVYQLLPRRARSYPAYQVLRAICSSAGSPFAMENRFDPVELKFIFRPADFDYRQAFNNRNAEKVGTSVQFDGILKTEHESALVLAHQSVTPAHVNTIVGTVQFLREWAADAGDVERHKELKGKWGPLLQKRTHMFLGTQTTPNKDLIAFARGKNVHLYAKRGSAYVYQQ
jgi:hypothetical protein